MKIRLALIFFPLVIASGLLGVLAVVDDGTSAHAKGASSALGEAGNSPIPPSHNVNSSETQTLAHELLHLELENLSRCGSANRDLRKTSIEVLERFLASTAGRISDLDVPDWNKATKAQALSALSEIDRALSEEGFVVCVKTKLLTQALSQPIPLLHEDDVNLHNGKEVCTLQRKPDYRDANIRRLWKQGLRPVDCDLGAILYLSVGERVGLPLEFVETPYHNFVRWRFANGDYLNWDNNDAKEYSDADFRNAVPKTVSRKFNKVEEKRNRYLDGRSRKEIVTYYSGIIASDLQKGECVVQLYETVKQAEWLDATTNNNFAWAFATIADFENSEFTRLSVDLATEAIRMQPTCNLWDTLSCAHAAAGEFEKAMEVERLHISSTSPRIPFFANKRSCYDPQVAEVGGCRTP